MHAAHYDETEARLAANPVVRDMAKDIALALEAGGHTIPDLVHSETLTPRFEFMMRANDEYARRTGGPVNGHIGAVASAIVRILTDPIDLYNLLAEEA